MGYSSKSPIRESWLYTSPKKSPEIFRFVTLHLEIPDKTRIDSWKFCKIVWHPLEIPRLKTKIHGNYIWFFLEHPWKSHFFFKWLLEFPHALSLTPLEIPCPQPNCLLFSTLAYPMTWWVKKWLLTKLNTRNLTNNSP